MTHDIQIGAKQERIILTLHSLSRDTQFELHRSRQQMKKTSIFLIRTSSSYKRHILIYMVVSYEQYWIISTNINYLYKKNTYLISKN
jgi:hypothetical protein